MKSLGRKQLVAVAILCMSAGVTTAQLTKPANIDDQKQIVMESVYSNPDFLPLVDVDQARIQLSDLSDSFQELADQYALLDDKREEIEKKYGNVQLTIDKIIRDTQKAKTWITDSLTKIALFTKKITELKEDLEVLEVEIEKGQQHLTHYTTFLYKLNNDYYGSDLEISDLKLLTKSDNIAATLSTDMLVQMLTIKLQALLFELQSQQVRYSDYTIELNKAKLAYEDTAFALKKDLESLEQQKKHLYLLLTYLQQDKASTDGEIHMIWKSKQELQRQLSVMRKVANSNLEEGLEQGTQIYTLLQLPDRDNWKRYFTWPVLPATRIQYYFNDPIYAQEFKENYNWLSIEIPQGTPVRAPAPGIVYSVHSDDDIELNRVVIVHKFWYTTFFSPLSEVFVKPGQLIKRGEIIGNSGGQPGTEGAWLETAVPHLSFEILKNGESIDPYSVLDLSIFNGEEELPAEHRMKYLQDYLAREVDLSNPPEVTGETVAERRDNFLERYATRPWNDATLWNDGAVDSGIDPLFGICIWFAETSFRNFKTTNNIGNVWNDDSGNTVEFESPLGGVKALFSVLNNQYLGDYYTIDELSRFGNKEWYIYASSPYNRQKNVMNCLTAIHGYKIPEDYPFRMRMVEWVIPDEVENDLKA